MGVHLEIHRAGVLVYIQDFLPSHATVTSHEHAALRVLPPEVPQCGHVDDVGVRRVNDDTAYVTSFAQPHVFPRAAAIDGLVHAFTPGRTLPVVCLTRPHPNHVGVGGGCRDIAH